MDINFVDHMILFHMRQHVQEKSNTQTLVNTRTTDNTGIQARRTKSEKSGISIF